MRRVLFIFIFSLFLCAQTTSAATVDVSQTITDGTLNLRITSDACSTDVASPSLTFGSTSFSFASQTSTAILAPSSQRLCIENPTGTPTWSITMAPSGGTTATWSNGTSTFDYNDSTSDVTDGADADSVGGRLAWTGGGTITGLADCATTGVAIGSSTSFSEGVTDTITILSASGSAATYCRFTYVASSANLRQLIPASQPGGSAYSLNVVLTLL